MQDRFAALFRERKRAGTENSDSVARVCDYFKVMTAE